MIKLGCNAMLREAEKLPHPVKDNSRNWIEVSQLVRRIRDWRLDIVDFQLFRGFASKDLTYLRALKILCQRSGLPIGFLGVGRGFVGEANGLGVALSAPELDQRIAEVKEGVDLAAFMGAPLVRIFAGAIPPESPNRDALWRTVVASFQQVCEYAAPKGVMVGLHNHAPVVAPSGDDVLRLLHDVDRENFTFILDTGWWPGAPGTAPLGPKGSDDFYAHMEQTAPHASYVRAKIYRIDSGCEEWLDYERIVEILRAVDFNGNMSIVFEGYGNRCSDFEAIRLAVAHLRKLLAS